MASCNEFTRASLLRAGIARAGRGLPAIETGMPAPAGTGLNRRTFLARSSGVALSVYGASLLAPHEFAQGIASASAASAWAVRAAMSATSLWRSSFARS